MKKSEFKQTKQTLLAMQPTPRKGVLGDEKKAHAILLIASGLSRREAAGYVRCAHTTIGRTAARDPDFAAKLALAEATSHVKAVSAIRGAMADPKYWRAAAWVLERRSPEEYARRDPNSFTADQVMSLLARLYSESLPLLTSEKVERFQELFDEALEEVEAKSSRIDHKDESPDEADQPLAAAAPSNKGHHLPDLEPTAESKPANGKPHADQMDQRERKSNEPLRRFHPAQLHHPSFQGAAALTADADRNPLHVNDLQQQSTDCTNPLKTEGRCNNGVVHTNGELSVPRDEG